MGRRKMFESEKFVSYDKETDVSECLECRKKLKGKLAGNIKRHYFKVHNQNIDSDSNISETVLKKQKTNKICVEMNKNEFLLCCVGLVTVKNIPFRIFDDEQYFKRLILPYEKEFNLLLNSKNVVEHVSIAAYKIKEIISAQVKNRMICLKMDVATRMEKSVLGVNIQYVNNFNIVVRTIGMIQLKKRHTAQFLKNEIIRCLREINVDISQIYSSTTDNGANVLKTSKLLHELQEEIMNTNEDQKSTDSSSDSDDEYENIHLTLKAVLAVVRCAAHTIQLAAHDVLKTIVEKVDECRKTVKIVRGIMRSTETNFQMPVLDNATRWNSTYFMIKSLIEIRNLIDNLEDGIPEVDWNFIIDFLSAFKPLAACTMKLQNEKYVIGDFFRDWLCCEIELEEIANSNNYANLLLRAMMSRKDKLFDNDAFIAALYVDPRFNFLNTPFLNEDQKKQAMVMTISVELSKTKFYLHSSQRHLLKTNTFIKRLEGEAGAETNGCGEDSSSSSSLPTFNSHFCKLEERTKALLGAPTNSTERTIKQKLGSLPYGERIPFDSDVLSYWSDLNHKDPHMGKLVEVVLATPCTQVSVERAFSALSTILTKLRSKLSKDTINNLLIVKLNSNIFDNISLVPSEDNM